MGYFPLNSSFFVEFFDVIDRNGGGKMKSDDLMDHDGLRAAHE